MVHLDICNETEAISFCKDCDKNYCNDCFIFLHKKKKNHLNIENPKEKFTSFSCDIHINRSVEYLCLDCSVLVCVECLIKGEKHYEHNQKKIPEASEEIKYLFEQKENKLKDLERIVDENLKILEKEEKSVQRMNEFIQKEKEENLKNLKDIKQKISLLSDSKSLNFFKILIHESKRLTLKRFNILNEYIEVNYEGIEKINRRKDLKGDIVTGFFNHKDNLTGFCQLSDHNFASISWDGVIKIWNSEGKEIEQFVNNKNQFETISEMKNGNLLISSDDYSISIWNRNGKCLKIGYKHSDYVKCLFELKNGNIISGALDNYIMLWNSNCEHLKTFFGHSDPITNVIELNDDRIASCSKDQTLKIWNLDGQCLKSIDFKYIINSIFQRNDGTIICATEKKIVIIDPLGGKKLEKISNELNNCVIELSDETIVSGDDNGSIKFWKNGKMRKELKGHNEPIIQIKLTMNGNIVSLSSNSILVWS